MCLPGFVCLSVRKITQKHLHGFGHISHATRNFTSGKSDVYVLVTAARCSFKMVLRPTAAATRGFTMVSFH